ncbi:hypothetical protein ACWTQY_32150, partial [Klebsiella pneumoniae]
SRNEKRFDVLHDYSSMLPFGERITDYAFEKRVPSKINGKFLGKLLSKNPIPSTSKVALETSLFV